MRERKVGVYICHCGGNISDYVDVDRVKAAVEEELGVTVSRTTMFTCSDASQTEMIADIREQGLDGMVVASCSPKLHLTTFRNVAERAGLNQFQYVQVNIREQCSWAHSDDREGATEKAIGLVKGGLEKAKLTEPLEPIRVTSVKSVLVIGAGVAGMRAALEMSDLGVEVFLVEREHFIGGEVGRLGKIYPSGKNGGEVSAELYDEIIKRTNIHLFTGAEMTSKEGYIGNFNVRVKISPRFVTGTEGDFEKAERECPVEVPSEFHRGLMTRKAIFRPGGSARPEKWAIDAASCTKCGKCAEVCPRSIDLEQQDEFVMLDAGAIITATGFESYKPSEGESGYGTGGVVTLPMFKSLVDNTGSRLEYGGREIRDVVFIYCVGSRQDRSAPEANRYCSRFCCNAAVGASLDVSEKIPGIRTWHLYRDVRTYGKFETLYEEASKEGAVFCRFDPKSPPVVEEDGERLLVRVNDLLTGGDEIGIEADLVVLVTGMVPPDNAELTSLLRLPLGEDGFYNEIHTKLRPVETVIDGVYIGGCSQGPKNSTESIASSLSCVAKAAALLVKGYVDLQPFIAYVMNERCEWCGECEKACPYSAIEKETVDGREVAVVRDVLCKGCGACLPVCPYDATQLKGFTDDQVKAMIEAFAGEAAGV
jgi:heterodisulfide reductase subunit A